jgi:hypothetical protein
MNASAPLSAAEPVHFRDHPANPLVEPPWPEVLLGDPAVVTPAESPDKAWHLFANSMRGIHHYTSPDGVHWGRHDRVGPGWRANVVCEDGLWHLFYEHFTVPQFRSYIARRTSRDLWSWTEPAPVLRPELAWEGRWSRNCGNPCVVRVADGWRLYYSANVVFLPDLGFCEPRHVGVANAPSLAGPWTRAPQPLLSPAADDPWRNRGAGAIKVIADPRHGWLGFNNGIYTDAQGRSRSAILLLASDDGLRWRALQDVPVLAPEGNGWKQALVYQLDVKRVGDELWLYYNARSDWRFGRERIGLAIGRV